MALTVASLHIYPIKSLGGFSVKESRTTERGFEHDRRWMLVDGNGRFISQREAAAMACLHCTPLENGFRVTDLRDGATIDLPWSINSGEQQRAMVWSDAVSVLPASAGISAWFAQKLDAPCTLVFMPEESLRSIDPTYANGITSLSDGFPYLIVSQASLDDLNERITCSRSPGGGERIPMDRFRPNIVIAGGSAFQEDGWKEVSIGDARFSLVKPCARCAVPTIDQRTGEMGKEPTRTLATYRRRVTEAGAVKVEFGMNAMGTALRPIQVDDPVTP